MCKKWTQRRGRTEGRVGGMESGLDTFLLKLHTEQIKRRPHQSPLHFFYKRRGW